MPADLRLYYSHRPDFRFGDLLQWQTEGSLLSSGIEWHTARDRSEYEILHGINASHSSVLVSMSQFAGKELRMWTLEALASGITLDILSTDLANYSGKLWWYPLKDEIGTDAFRQTVGESAFSFMSIPYAVGDLFEQLVKRIKIDFTSLFCSEYCQINYLRALGMSDDEIVQQIARNPNQMPSMGIFKEPVLIFDNPLPVQIPSV